MEQRQVQTEYVNQGKTVVGYAAVFNSPARVFERGKAFTETIAPGAFRNALASGGDIISTFNHDNNRFLGRTSNKTLRLSEDEQGLKFELDLPDTATGNEVRALIERGDLRGASFRFGVRKGGETWDKDSRTLTDLYLDELGPVVQPVYSSTSVGLRSALPAMLMRLRLAKM